LTDVSNPGVRVSNVEGVWTVRVVSRRSLERMDRALDEEWNGRLDAEARAARLVMIQCDRVLLGWGGIYGIALLVPCV
jgi:hypothetical protein